MCFSINEREKTKPKKRNLFVVFDFRKKQLKQERKRPNKKLKKIFLGFLLINEKNNKKRLRKAKRTK